MSELLRITSENFERDVLQSETPVIIDFWGPQCIPCRRLDPFVEALDQEFGGRVKFARVVAPENRQLCVQLHVMGLPTFLAFSGAQEVGRLVHDANPDTIRSLAEQLTAS